MVGNRVFLLALLAVVAIGATFVRWGTIVVTPGSVTSTTEGGQPMPEIMQNLFEGMFNGQSLPIDGIHGSVSLGPLQIPLWFCTVAVVFGAVVSSLNLLQFTKLPSAIAILSFLFAFAVSVWASCMFLLSGSIGLGSILFLVVSVVGVLAVLFQPKTAVGNSTEVSSVD